MVLSTSAQGIVAAEDAANGFWIKGAEGGFVRNNTRSDLFTCHGFHHIEFWCSDATNVYKRFQVALGMGLVAKSDQSTGNSTCASYVLQSHETVFAFTAPYSRTVACHSLPGQVPLPGYSADAAFDFITKHGLAVRAVGLTVDDAAAAFQIAVSHGAIPCLAPVTLGQGSAQQVIAEVFLYGDVVFRFVSGDHKNPFLLGYQRVQSSQPSYGIRRLDHAVGNVPVLADAIKHIMGYTGFHEFAEFVADDVGTLDSGLNSVVLANNNEYVLLPINEPTFGTKRKSQIQTFLEQNEGAGLQHLALKTDDIFHTLRQMRAQEAIGFEFMPRASDAYYRDLPQKVGNALTPQQLAWAEELGILVDRDDQGVLLQIFTKPLGDRPTIFIEIIHRVGCLREQKPQDQAQLQATAEHSALAPNEPQAAGCGGFGKGNFSELFKRIEDYERTLVI